MNDRRKKGCPNEQCIQHINKVRTNTEIDYCPKCGTKQILVCARCFSEIEDIDTKHRVCIRCRTEAEEKRARAVEKGKAFAKKYVAAPVAAIGVGLFVDMQKDVVKKGIQFVITTAGVILKK